MKFVSFQKLTAIFSLIGYMLLPYFATAQNDQVLITGTVSPNPTSFNIDFKASQGKNVPPDTVIEYTLTYSSNLQNSSSFTLEAIWSLGTVKGEQAPSVEIVSYVPGSATKGYNNTEPIIDIANRRIRWEIKDFPGNKEEHTVTFKLKTVSETAFNQPIDFSVQARLFQPDMSLPFKTINHTYAIPIAPTPVITPKTTPTIPPLIITKLDIREIRETSFSFYIETSNPSQTRVVYGENLEFDNVLNHDQFLSGKIIDIGNLKPDTTYYFMVTVTDEYGQTYFPSEIYVVRTASRLLPDALDIERLLVSAKGITLIDNSISPQDEVLIPLHTPIDIFLPFNDDIVSNVFVRIVNKRVLGLTTFRQPHFLERTNLIEAKPSLFSGQLQTPNNIGEYDVIVGAEDKHGNLFQRNLFTLRVSNPLQVINEEGSPVEKAAVLIEKYNPQNNLFERWQAESAGMSNPEYTNPQGQIPFILPAGKYRFVISAINYETLEATLDFSPHTSQYYPAFRLTKATFSLTALFNYYQDVTVDTASYLNQRLNEVSASNRFINLNLLIALAIASILSLVLTARRLELSLFGIVVYVKKFLPNQKDSHYLHRGLLKDNASKLPIHGATIYAISNTTQQTLDSCITSLLGEFTLNLEPNEEYKIVIDKPNYYSKQNIVRGSNLPGSPTFYLDKKQPSRSTVSNIFMFIVNTLGKSLADTLLIATLTIHIILIFNVGYYQILPLTVITTINVILWFEFSWKKWQQKLTKI